MTNSLLVFVEISPKLCVRLNHNDNGELITLCRNITQSAQNAVPFKSWTTRMLSLGAFAILKKISEETAEFVIAVCRDRPLGACEECADLIYHILLLFVGFEIQFERLFEALQLRLNRVVFVTSLILLEEIAQKVYVDIVRDNFNKNKFESVVDAMIRELYSSVSLLTALCLRININVEASAANISNAVCEVFINAIALLHYRGIRYQSVSDLLIARCYR
ncbi:MAG: phosphoribosyl-ATP diphosphatase [Candidatus Hodgkinia cicadicola]